MTTNCSEAACTIVSKNYISYARTLCESYLKQHPNNQFYVLLVDRNNGDIDVTRESFNLIEVEELPLDNFHLLAFTFDVLELNTNVKPSFLKYLFNEYAIDKLIYFDPDIFIYQAVDVVYSLLDTYSIVLTPHCNTPIEDECRPNEQDFLKAGVFNLGFIALRNDREARRSLDWWEKRCLSLGYNEIPTGLFVDQKWMNFAPCFFEKVYVLKHLGCNMAYWNLHERTLEKRDFTWTVNGEVPLVFFHFSGVDVVGKNNISKYQDRYTFMDRPDLRELFEQYMDTLLRNNIETTRNYSYHFGTYTDGSKITSIARRIFSIKKEFHTTENPFLINGQFYKWAQNNGLLAKTDQSNQYNSRNYNKADWRLRFINWLLKMLLFILGADRYTMLMRYLAYISVLRNQKDLFE